VKRGAATEAEADREIEDVDNGENEDSSDLITVSQQNTVAVGLVNDILRGVITWASPRRI
jgi:hypothetical protein